MVDAQASSITRAPFASATTSKGVEFLVSSCR